MVIHFEEQLKLNPNAGWQAMLNTHLEDCIAFFFPKIHRSIDWSKGYKVLDREWQSVRRKNKANQRFIGRLVRLTSIDGKKETILLHVASEKDDSLPFHLFTYHYRINDLYHQSAIPLVILADDDPDWRPEYYQSTIPDYSVAFHLQTCKLLDYQKSTLEQIKNPLAFVVLAHLTAIETRGNTQARYLSKLELTRLILGKNYNEDTELETLKLVDWLLLLTKELALEYESKVYDLWYEKGYKKGKRQVTTLPDTTLTELMKQTEQNANHGE